MSVRPGTSPTVRRVVERVVPPSGRSVPGIVRLVAVPVVVAAVVAGVWLTGGVVTDDYDLARVLTGAWFAVAGLLAVVVGLRWRVLAAPVIGAYVLSLLVVGGYLGLASTQQRVVNEDVVVAEPRAGEGANTTGVDQGGSGAVTLTSGGFRSQAHETSGVATLVERADGARVVTLTEFATDPGPDLRVYLVPGDGDSADGAVDLGALKGNEGDQQYEVPDGVAPEEAGAVVIWCRAFSVSFGAAALSPA